MRIERRKREPVYDFKMHRQENMAGLYSRYNDRDGIGCTAPRTDANHFTCGDAESLGVIRVYLDREDGGSELAEDGAFVGARPGVPLR